MTYRIISASLSIITLNIVTLLPANVYEVISDNRVYEKDGYTVTYMISSEPKKIKKAVAAEPDGKAYIPPCTYREEIITAVLVTGCCFSYKCEIPIFCTYNRISGCIYSLYRFD